MLPLAKVIVRRFFFLFFLGSPSDDMPSCSSDAYSWAELLMARLLLILLVLSTSSTTVAILVVLAATRVTRRIAAESEW